MDLWPGLFLFEGRLSRGRREREYCTTPAGPLSLAQLTLWNLPRGHFGRAVNSALVSPILRNESAVPELCRSTYIVGGSNDDDRQYAAECLEALKFTTSAEAKAALLLMAERWDKLAEYVERASGIRPNTQQDQSPSTR